jgi:flagellar motor switch protein FliN/FliY
MAEDKKEIEVKEELSSFADIKLKIHVEVGRSKKHFLDVLNMKEGDIIKLDKSLEDYIDLYINGSLFAIGELVVVNEKYGIRIVDLA